MNDRSDDYDAATRRPIEAPDWDVKFGRILRLTAMISTIVASVTLSGTILLFVYTTGLASWEALIKEHFPATIGLIGASILSFAVVVFLRQTEGPIEFEAVGMKFHGAAGQVVLWAFCIVVLVLCTKLLW